MKCYRMAVGLMVCLVATAFGAEESSSSGAYRGPLNNGIFADTGLLKKWPADGPKLLWKAPVGIGWSAATVVDGLVYIAGGSSGLLHVFTLEGELKAKIPFGPTDCKRFSGTRSVPLVSEGVGIVSAPSSSLWGLDVVRGETLWQISAWKSFGSGNGGMGWGFPESPLLVDDKVVFNACSRDDQSPPIVAVNKFTGKLAWAMDPGKESKKYSAADTSGSCVTHNGRRLIFYPTWRFLVCLEAAQLRDSGRAEQDRPGARWHTGAVRR